MVSVGGSEFLHYKAAKVDIALLKGTTADSKGREGGSLQGCRTHSLI